MKGKRIWVESPLCVRSEEHRIPLKPPFHPIIVRTLGQSRAAVALLATLFSIALPAHAQTPAGTTVRTGGVELTVNARVHTQFNTTSVDSVPIQESLVRRAGLQIGMRADPRVSGRLQVEFAGDRARLGSAYVQLSFTPALQLIVGNAHRPFGLLVQTSSNRILPVERGTQIRGLPRVWDETALVARLGYANRDVGVQLEGAPVGAPLGLFYAVGIFNGPARDPEVRVGTHQVGARVGVRPGRNMAVAASWSRRDFVHGSRREAGRAVAVDVEVGTYAPGLHLMAEAVAGDFNPIQGTRFAGAQAWLGYRSGPVASGIAHLEPTLRLSVGDPDRDGSAVTGGGVLFTPGLNVYLGGLNRVMLNYDVWTADSGQREHGGKVQFQLAL